MAQLFSGTWISVSLVLASYVLHCIFCEYRRNCQGSRVVEVESKGGKEDCLFWTSKRSQSSHLFLYGGSHYRSRRALTFLDMTVDHESLRFTVKLITWAQSIMVCPISYAPFSYREANRTDGKDTAPDIFETTDEPEGLLIPVS